MNPLDHIAPDEPWKLALCAAIILGAIAWMAWQKRREQRMIRVLANNEVRPYLAYAVEEMERLNDQVQEHHRVLELATNPEQEAIDAAIAEADEAEAIGRRMVV